MGSLFSIDVGEFVIEASIPEDPDPMRRVALALREDSRIMVITGAGISAESGIPTYRETQNALWNKFDAYKFASLSAFREDPTKIYTLFNEMRLQTDAKPNAAHFGLAKLQKKGLIKGGIFTQNVDNLHQLAGATDVVEFHGNCRELICLQCKKIKPLSKDSLPDYAVNPPKCKKCGVYLKPNCTLFGEELPAAAIDRAYEEVKRCDLLLVIGTSANVQPVNTLPVLAKQNGAKIIEINPEVTPFSRTIADLYIPEPAAEAFTRIMTFFDALPRTL